MMLAITVAIYPTMLLKPSGSSDVVTAPICFSKQFFISVTPFISTPELTSYSILAPNSRSCRLAAQTVSRSGCVQLAIRLNSCRKRVIQPCRLKSRQRFERRQCLRLTSLRVRQRRSPLKNARGYSPHLPWRRCPMGTRDFVTTSVISLTLTRYISPRLRMEWLVNGPFNCGTNLEATICNMSFLFRQRVSLTGESCG
jgi:hypothetical protein